MPQLPAGRVKLHRRHRFGATARPRWFRPSPSSERPQGQDRLPAGSGEMLTPGPSPKVRREPWILPASAGESMGCGMP
jgi:hypothetical protein